MAMDWVFTVSDYREVIRRKIVEEGDSRGYKSTLARAAGCQPAYLSQVLAESVHLTPEHGAELCDLWQLDDLEADYFLTLIHLGRSGRESLERRLKAKLKELREAHKKLKSQRPKSESRSYEKEQALHYYLDWIPAALHLYLTIPGRNTVAVLAKRTQLPESAVSKGLGILENLGIAKAQSGAWELTAKTLHASDESLFAPLHHRNWRERAIESFRAGTRAPNLHYTAVYSLDPDTFHEIRGALKKTIALSRASAIKAPEEDVACLNIDWFGLPGAEFGTR